MSALVIVDYGMGNLRSIVKKFDRIGVSTVVSGSPAEVASADKLVLPGVGHFGGAMRTLEASGLRGALETAVHGRGVPILGICLGMQLLALRSEESDTEGLGWLDADVVRFAIEDPLRFKVPQMGWNSVVVVKASKLTDGLAPDSEFYFAHSYHMVCREASDVLGETEYAYRFPSAVERGNVYGVQFHPEKSHDVGEAMLLNFARL